MGSGLSWNTQIVLLKPGPRNPGIPGTLPWDQPASLCPSRASSQTLFIFTLKGTPETGGGRREPGHSCPQPPHSNLIGPSSQREIPKTLTSPRHSPA